MREIPEIKVNVEDDERYIASPLEDGLDFVNNIDLFFHDFSLNDKELENEDARLKGILDPTTLRKKKVTIFGAGSVGSWVMYFLASYIDYFRVIDRDRVEAANLKGRTIYSESDIGRVKVYALEDKLKRWNPNVRVNAYPCALNELTDKILDEEILDSDLCICAIDDIQSVLRINRLTYGKIISIYPGVYSRATGGFVIITAPETPCFKCSMEINESDDIEPLHAEPAFGLEITQVALACSRLAIYLLIRDQNSELSKRVALEKSNFLEIDNRSGEFRWLPTQRKRKCEICNR